MQKLYPAITYAIKEFYCSDNISRVMSGKKDFMALKANRTKTS
jgi:hypothetical protein